LTKLFVPHFTKNSAQIVYINSSAGVNPGLENGLYSATKHGLKAVADSFRKELNKSGIRVISIYPGRTATPMQKEIYSYENREYLPKRLLQPEDIAIAVENALCMPKTAEITDLFIRPFYKTD
jgi:NADP-dependent 3-hydroxy acid dehydrogenase YdfG